jgi:ABC-2 type transport system permease protein
LRESLVVAFYTIKDIVRSKVGYYILLLMGLIQLLSFLAKELTYAVPMKMVLDIGLGTTSISSVLLALLIGSRLMADEIEARSIYMVLARPISRISYLSGKVLGASAVLLIGILLIAATVLINVVLLDGVISSLMLWAVIFMMIETVLVLLIAILLSNITNNLITMLSTVAIYVAGHLIHDGILLDQIKSYPLLSALFEAGGVVLPNFSRLGILDHLLYQQTVLVSYLWVTLLYGVGYLLLLLVVTGYLFQRRELV